jgi:hypothetical protein
LGGIFFFAGKMLLQFQNVVVVNEIFGEICPLEGGGENSELTCHNDNSLRKTVTLNSITYESHFAVQCHHYVLLRVK